MRTPSKTLGGPRREEQGQRWPARAYHRTSAASKACRQQRHACHSCRSCDTATSHLRRTCLRDIPALPPSITQRDSARDGRSTCVVVRTALAGLDVKLHTLSITGLAGSTSFVKWWLLACIDSSCLNSCSPQRIRGWQPCSNADDLRVEGLPEPPHACCNAAMCMSVCSARLHAVCKPSQDALLCMCIARCSMSLWASGWLAASRMQALIDQRCRGPPFRQPRLRAQNHVSSLAEIIDVLN